MDARELDTLDMVLPRGRARACTVADLQTDMSDCIGAAWGDRAVREGLQQLVNERRVPVVTLPTNPGVFVAVTPEELDLADAHLRAKAMSLLNRRRSLRLCRERLAYSPTLFEVRHARTGFNRDRSPSVDGVRRVDS